MSEHHPLTVFREVAVEWQTPKFNLEELAALHDKGMAIKELMKHFECGQTTLFKWLRHLRERSLQKD